MSMQTIFVMSDEASALSELCAGAGAVAARVTAILFGSEAEAAGAAGCGADRLLYCQPSDGAVPEDYAAAVAQEVKKEASALVIVNNTIRGRCLAGKLGVLLDTAVLTSVNALERSGEELVCCRMVYGGIAQRSEVFTKPYGVLTVGGGVFEAAAEPAQAAVAPFEGLPQGGLKRIACTPKKEGGVDLVAAKRIWSCAGSWLLRWARRLAVPVQWRRTTNGFPSPTIWASQASRSSPSSSWLWACPGRFSTLAALTSPG